MQDLRLAVRQCKGESGERGMPMLHALLEMGVLDNLEDNSVACVLLHVCRLSAEPRNARLVHVVRYMVSELAPTVFPALHITISHMRTAKLDCEESLCLQLSRICSRANKLGYARLCARHRNFC